MCVSVFLNYICAAHACLVPLDVRKGCQILWNMSDRRSLAAVWVLGTEPRLGRTVSTLSHRAVSPTPDGSICNNVHFGF